MYQAYDMCLERGAAVKVIRAKRLTIEIRAIAGHVILL